MLIPRIPFLGVTHVTHNFKKKYINCKKRNYTSHVGVLYIICCLVYAVYTTGVVLTIHNYRVHYAHILRASTRLYLSETHIIWKYYYIRK